MSRIGLVMVIGGVVVLGLGLAGVSELVPCLVLGLVLAVIGTTIALIGRGVARTFERDAALVGELATRGVRRHGTVKDALPLTSPEHGTPMFQPDGAQMVLRIELDAEGGRRTVTCHVVEPSEAAKARIGSEVVVIEHPENQRIRALEGFKPNGLRA